MDYAQVSEGSATCRWRKRYAALREDQSTWRPHWKDIVDNLLPRKGRYLSGENVSQSNDGRKKNQNIINGIAGTSLRTMAAGLQGGLTSPSRPWFQLSLPDDDLIEFGAVRDWLHDCRNRMLQVFARSNFYASMHNTYYEIGAFGIGAMIMDEDLKNFIRCRPLTIGEYCVDLDDSYRPCALYRQFAMTADQMQAKFGTGKDKLGNLPQQVVQALQQQTSYHRFEVIHVIERTRWMDSQKADYRGMEYSSVYFPYNVGDQDLILKQSGYRGNPFIAPRWNVTGVDTYGDSPAMQALGDIKQLQKMEEKKLKALDKMVDPPMNAPTSMMQRGGTIVAGGMNFVDPAQGGQSFTPSYQVNPNLQQMDAAIHSVQDRIQEAFFNNLFLSLLDDNKQMTATEVAKRYEEKIMVLGPVFETLSTEALDPVVDRVFSIMENLGLLPPIPKEIPPGMQIKVEYISMLAQAQKLVETTSVDQLLGFTLNIAKANPDALDKIDFDEAVDQYGGMLNVPPKIVRSDEEVQQLRQQKQQQQAAAQKMAMAQQASETAQNAAGAVNQMGNTPYKDGTALESMMQKVLGAGGAPGAPGAANATPAPAGGQIPIVPGQQ